MSGERLNDEPAHSAYGPSRAEGYSSCLDYVRANDGLPDEATEQAAEGTFAHQISDECLTFDMDAADFVGQSMRVGEWTFTWTEEDAYLLQPGLDWTRARGGEFHGEHRVDVSRWTAEGQFGTLDRAILVEIDNQWWVIVTDLKWGRGVPVSPVRNKQLALYTLGFYESVRHRFTEPPRFLLAIDQPRCPGGGGYWETTLDELEAIGAYIRERVEISQSVTDAVRTASELGCMWCRRKNAPGGCSTYDTWRLEQLQPWLTATSLTADQRAMLLRHRQGIVKWLDRLEDAALNDTLNGKSGGGMKAVVDTRKGSRDKWIDEAEVVETLLPVAGEKIFTKKLKTPKQLRKELPSDEARGKLTGLYEPAQHGYSLVPVEDARPAVRLAAADDFEDL